jgi:hypothetical protein
MPDYLQGIPDNPQWLNVWRAWLAERGLGVFVRNYCCGDCSVPPGYSILSVECSHHPDSHAVVCLDGVVVHDPLPGELCPEAVKRHWYVFTVLDPSKVGGSTDGGSSSLQELS